MKRPVFKDLDSERLEAIRRRAMAGALLNLERPPIPPKVAKVTPKAPMAPLPLPPIPDRWNEPSRTVGTKEVANFFEVSEAAIRRHLVNRVRRLGTDRYLALDVVNWIRRTHGHTRRGPKW